ncbi:glycine cleavage system aminomethyltransferase GcvT [Roseitranquillus sediminis]|uniref:glycine cleavage system aminomethyltransferase GcvT n=1 Tax=Roseitranquillus sediminis TaxID=2809051 RepID=UPI001D0CCF09|nr:glycine cleavage system aminomethyltransferase GcvT [Roseitranquillus sediminis]MBM9593523.1 glycine cleavage system aminomethyltransferase GcvT [Roseitranquillus sediminis]
MADTKRTPLHGLHEELGARMTPFAGWEMPLQFAGVMSEHLHTRAAASLFDVSHMGQVVLRATDVAAALERLTPAAVIGLPEGRQRYALFTDENGGIIDDLMVANRGDHLFLVVNASRVDVDLAHMRENLPELEVEHLTDRALIALQGPGAERALARIAPEVAGMRFMDAAVVPMSGGELWVSRSGYTGEDGYEISVPAAEAEGLARSLLAMDEVEPAGLGARDSLRLEAGLCLHGQDIDETTTPIEADLAWSIQKARRRGGDRAGGFPGAERILDELENGPARRRVGLLPDGRAPMRAGTALYDGDVRVGEVTSGAYGPSIGRPMSMGYVDANRSAPGTALTGEVRGKRLPATVTELPFRPATYKR